MRTSTIFTRLSVCHILDYQHDQSEPLALIERSTIRSYPQHDILPRLLPKTSLSPVSPLIARSLPAAAMATATLPLRHHPSKTLTLPSLPFARLSFAAASPVPRSWRVLAAAEEAPEPVEVEFVEPEAEAAVQETVEAQLSAAGAGKDADIFAVVMVGKRQRH
jgi:hypothetical protein